MPTTASRSRSKIKFSGAPRARSLHRRRRRKGSVLTNGTPSLMRDIYKRLRAIGFDEAFIRERVLPDWWDDSLANVPTTRAVAEATIASVLDIPVALLRDPSARLELPAVSEFRLKRNKGTKPTELAPAVHVAFRAARAVQEVVTGVGPFRGMISAGDVRRTILTARAFVDLESLVDFAWNSGILVLHLGSLPRGSKKFSGVAAFCGDRPIVILGSGHDSAPWIAFHLAHEIAHILLGHVTSESKPLIDSDLDTVDRSEQESEADAFACEVLTGYSRPEMTAVYGLTAAKLAHHAKTAASSNRIHPGTFALIYGRSASRMGVAQNALKLMGMDRGGQRILAESLVHHLPEELPETTERFLRITAG